MKKLAALVALLPLVFLVMGAASYVQNVTLRDIQSAGTSTGYFTPGLKAIDTWNFKGGLTATLNRGTGVMDVSGAGISSSVNLQTAYDNGPSILETTSNPVTLKGGTVAGLSGNGNLCIQYDPASGSDFPGEQFTMDGSTFAGGKKWKFRHFIDDFGDGGNTLAVTSQSDPIGPTDGCGWEVWKDGTFIPPANEDAGCNPDLGSRRSGDFWTWRHIMMRGLIDMVASTPSPPPAGRGGLHYDGTHMQFAEAGSWVNFSNAGPTGPTGPNGANGATGPTGPTGPAFAGVTFTPLTSGDGTPSQVHNSLTTRQVNLFQLPYDLTVTKITIGFQSVTSAGTLKTCIYDSAGNKVIDGTLTPAAGTSPPSATVASTTLHPGNYYLVTGCATTCNVATDGISNGFNTWAGTNTHSVRGTVTHTSGTCNTTLGAITNAVTTGRVMFQLD